MKIKNKIILGLIAFMLFTPTVYAAENDTVSKYFEKVAPNGVFTVDSIRPTSYSEAAIYGQAYFEQNFTHAFDSYYLVYSNPTNCNDDFSECDLRIGVRLDNDRAQTEYETHRVKVEWQENNTEHKSIADSYIAKINTAPHVVYKDLELINFFNYCQNEKDVEHAAPYSLSKIIDNDHVTYYYALENGGGSNLNRAVTGNLVIYYDGVAYGSVRYMIERINAIYIPDETENTSEAYIAAAKKRLDEYLNSDTAIKKAGQTSSLGEATLEYYGDADKMGDYYYNVTIGDLNYDFLIIRNSSKMIAPSLQRKDSTTNVSVSTNSTVPLDASLKVTAIETTSQAFKNIKDILKIADDEAVQAYDISLFSKTTNSNITRLDEGEFKVSVPISESLADKELVAYYVTDDNKVEEHPVTVVGGIGSFKTNHFSTYTIAEARQIENVLTEKVPETYDNIMLIVVTGIIGVIGLATTTVFLKKKEN